MLSKRQREEQINRGFGHDLQPEVLLCELQHHPLSVTAYAHAAPATWGLLLCKWRESPHLPAILEALRAPGMTQSAYILAAALAQAAEDGHVELVKEILAAQVPHPPIQFWSITRWACYSALRVAAANGRKDCFAVLLAYFDGSLGKTDEKLLRAILRLNTSEVL